MTNMNVFNEFVQQKGVMATLRDEQRRETSAKVLTIADELFRSKGFAETTIRDIATASEVSVGTVMSVGDKNTLLVACFDRLIQRIHHERAQKNISTKPEVSLDHLVALFEPFIDAFTSHPELSRAYGSILVAGNHTSTVFTELADVLIGEIASAIQKMEHVDEQVASSLAASVYFAYIGRLFTWPIDSDGATDELKLSLRQTIAAICRFKE